MSRNTRSQTPVYDWNNNQHLWIVARRLKEVQIENGDALTVIKRDDADKIIQRPWRGYEVQTVRHPIFGAEPVEVFAIWVNPPSNHNCRGGGKQCE